MDGFETIKVYVLVSEIRIFLGVVATATVKKQGLMSVSDIKIV